MRFFGFLRLLLNFLAEGLALFRHSFPLLGAVIP